MIIYYLANKKLDLIKIFANEMPTEESQPKEGWPFEYSKEYEWHVPPNKIMWELIKKHKFRLLVRESYDEETEEEAIADLAKLPTVKKPRRDRK